MTRVRVLEGVLLLAGAVCEGGGGGVGGEEREWGVLVSGGGSAEDDGGGGSVGVGEFGTVVGAEEEGAVSTFGVRERKCNCREQHRMRSSFDQ